MGRGVCWCPGSRSSKVMDTELQILKDILTTLVEIRDRLPSPAPPLPTLRDLMFKAKATDKASEVPDAR
jgi:hypothetical protein